MQVDSLAFNIKEVRMYVGNNIQGMSFNSGVITSE